MDDDIDSVGNEPPDPVESRTEARIRTLLWKMLRDMP